MGSVTSTVRAPAVLLGNKGRTPSPEIMPIKNMTAEIPRSVRAPKMISRIHGASQAAYRAEMTNVAT